MAMDGGVGGSKLDGHVANFEGSDSTKQAKLSSERSREFWEATRGLLGHMLATAARARHPCCNIQFPSSFEELCWAELSREHVEREKAFRCAREGTGALLQEGESANSRGGGAGPEADDCPPCDLHGVPIAVWDTQASGGVLWQRWHCHPGWVGGQGLAAGLPQSGEEAQQRQANRQASPVRRSWTAASPPGLKAESPSQPTASGLRCQCGASCSAPGWTRPPLGTLVNRWAGTARQPSTPNEQGRPHSGHWSCAGGNTEERLLPRARRTQHWASRSCETEHPRPQPSSL
ncbi:hypothetical protein HaLaN_01044 [Haematococcus lacustris]|uniref:Uncharacterized protein n=1 Tax=Haematococcus lacustris TaxID=44745 RepID=A0A699Y8B8_HAELA|nr:hypothetical protein HaLaN_01044 [Haematococcus lacustris]